MPSASPAPATAASATRLVRAGRTLLSFAGTGYLGLAHHPAVLDAAREALARCGLSAGAARGTTGTFDEHEALEEELARFLGVEAVALAPDGWLADAAALEALAPEVDALLLDVDAHAALRAAARLVDLPRHDYAPHALDEARAWLDARGAHRPALLCDGVHPMAQRVAKLPLLLELVGPRGALVVDDSHGLGVLGAHGRGTVEAFALRDARLVVTGSLAKALGAGGGFVAGDVELVARVRTSSAAYNTTTPVPPAVAAGARAALRVLVDDPARLERLRANARRLDALAARRGLARHPWPIPVLALPLPDAERGRAAQAALDEAGLVVPWTRYGGGAGDLRVAVTSEHDADDLARLEDVLERVLPCGREGARP